MQERTNSSVAFSYFDIVSLIMLNFLTCCIFTSQRSSVAENLDLQFEQDW